MQRAYLFADPAAHSRSPAMHGAAFAWAGIAGVYEARQVPPAELEEAVRGLRAPDILGANLSLPHKEAVMRFLDELTPAARAIGAVNTIVHRDGRLIGDNTDAPGLLSALSEAGDAGQGEAVVLGAGGAARAAVWALRDQGRQVYVINRTHEKALALTRELGGVPRRLSFLEETYWPNISLLVNASSVGLDDPDSTPLPHIPYRYPDSAPFLVYDMVYQPSETRLMRDARAQGLRAENGLTMLAHQARLAFRSWTGVDVPIQIFLNALNS